MGVELARRCAEQSESHSPRLAKVITLIITTADGEFAHQTACSWLDMCVLASHNPVRAISLLCRVGREDQGGTVICSRLPSWIQTQSVLIPKLPVLTTRHTSPKVDNMGTMLRASSAAWT